MWGELQDANVAWIAVAALASSATYLGAALALSGSIVEPLPVGPNLAVQLASSFASIAAPAQVGGVALKGRFLQRRGTDPAVAVAAIGLPLSGATAQEIPQPEGSIDVALQRLRWAGITPRTISQTLAHSYVSPVLTAHPTEVQRKSILDAERDIAHLLAERDAVKARAAAVNANKDALSPRELAANELQIRARVMQLWQTRLLRFTKLTVADEIENALSYYEATFLREIPKLYAELEAALDGQPVASFLRMGQWIGGDRDGNPNVTADTLEYALRRQCEVALRHYLTEVHYLGSELSLSAMLVPVGPEMQALAERSPDSNEHRQDEPYRRALTGMYARLAATLHAEMSYGQIDSILDDGLHTYLTQFLSQIHELGDAIHGAYLEAA